MYAGQIVEDGSIDDIFYDPHHPYTWGLLGSLCRTDRPRGERLTQIAGQPPSLVDLRPDAGSRRAVHLAFDQCARAADAACPRERQPPRPVLA